METEIGRSSLVGKTLTFAGFCFVEHSLDPSLHVMLSVYRMGADAHVICVSETAEPDEDGAKEGLGGDVPGEAIAPFAVRLLEGLHPTELKAVLSRSYPKATWNWAKDK